MDRTEIYQYFSLQARLYNSIINYIRHATQNTEQCKLPYKINSIVNAGTGLLRLDLEFLEDDGYKAQSFDVKIEELEGF